MDDLLLQSLARSDRRLRGLLGTAAVSGPGLATAPLPRRTGTVQGASDFDRLSGRQAEQWQPLLLVSQPQREAVVVPSRSAICANSSSQSAIEILCMNAPYRRLIKRLQFIRHRFLLTLGTIVACGLLLCLVPASPVVAQPGPVGPAPQPYLDVLELYRRGDYDTAVSTLRSWTEKVAQKAIVALMSRRTPALQIPDVPAMFAAAMLHTDAAFAAVEALKSAEASFHLRAAADLLIWTVLNVPDERRWLFSRRDWRLMVTRVLNYDFEWNVYQSLTPPATVPPRPGPPLGWAPTEMWIARANEIIEDDADMELAVGSLAEGFAFMNAQELKIAQDRKQRALVLQLRQRAESHFRRALGLRPDIVEARLRLGRVLFDEGRTAEAEEELRAVLKATTDTRTVHLALLFLGEVAEKDRRFEEATELYRRAVDIKPFCQAARIAFAYASERTGDLDRARSVVAWFLGRNQARSFPMDDWTSYPAGQYQAGYEALARLRASVVRK